MVKATDFFKKTRVFVDLNGVMSKWHPGADYRVPGYFRNLEAYEGMVDFVKALKESNEYEVHIMLRSPDSAATLDMLAWLYDRGFEDVKIEIIPWNEGESKVGYIENPRPTDIVIDDYSVELHQFERTGMRPIKALNGVNKGINWAWLGGASIDATKSFAEILAEFHQIMAEADQYFNRYAAFLK